MSLFEELHFRIDILKKRLYRVQSLEYRSNTHPSNMAFDDGFNAKMEDEIEFLEKLLEKYKDDLR